MVQRKRYTRKKKLSKRVYKRSKRVYKRRKPNTKNRTYNKSRKQRGGGGDEQKMDKLDAGLGIGNWTATSGELTRAPTRPTKRNPSKPIPLGADRVARGLYGDRHQNVGRDVHSAMASASPQERRLVMAGAPSVKGSQPPRTVRRKHRIQRKHPGASPEPANLELHMRAEGVLAESQGGFERRARRERGSAARARAEAAALQPDFHHVGEPAKPP